MSDHALKVEVHIKPAADLQSIDDDAKLYEESEGPLVAMGNEDGNTFLTFDCTGPSPTKFVAISKRVGAAPNVPQGATLVASGDLYVEGKVATCDAIRGP
jgi:hypothetical protein